MPRPDSRQAAIALALLSANGPISARELGSQIDLSARVVRYNLPMLQRWLTPYGARIIVKPRVGLSLAGSEPAREAIKSALSSHPSPINLKPSQRENYLIFELLTSDAYLTSSQLERRLGVSTSTLTRDLASLEERLAEQNIYLQRRPRVGTHVVGREADRRNALIRLILEAGLETSLLELCLWGRLSSRRLRAKADPVRTIILERLMSWGLEDAWRYIARVEHELKCTFADSDHLALALNWAAMINRFHGGNFVHMPSAQIKTLAQQPEYAAVESAAQLLQQESSMQLTPDEIAQFTLFVTTTTRSTDHSNRREQDKQPIHVAKEYIDLANQLAERIGQHIGTDLTHPEVLSRLADHLSRSLVRIRHGMPFQNPLTDEVRKAYPALWKATQSAVHELDQGTAFPAEEIAYITMYMGMALDLTRRLSRKPGRRVVIACPSGGVTVWMLVSRLKMELPELEVVDTISLRHISRVDSDDIDAIISTAKLNARNVPVITVSPLVNDQDIAQIRQTLSLN